MKTLKELYLFAKKELKEKEEGEALILSEAFLSAGRREISLYGEKTVPETESEKFLEAVKMRKENRPLQYITGYEYFGDMKLEVGEGVLIPREDTLPLCEVAAEFAGDKNVLGIDLCSGSGAIALYIVNKCKNSKVYAMELYEGAIKYLEKNIEAYGEKRVNFIKGDVLENPDENLPELDFIVSNPPYILTSEVASLQEEVKKEPVTALDGGEDGLVFYRHIVKEWGRKLKKGGLMAFEADPQEMEDIKKLLLNGGFDNIGIVNDLGDLQRVVYGYKK
ncbi:MAG: peptide chain release factor N(5)-glutamine methyltransferase [Ruminococcaceae bacterium]|nr:peptide chain release factor N(5)-glutamine methyltransferase [Oscillospiraceae bacterium]